MNVEDFLNDGIPTAICVLFIVANRLFDFAKSHLFKQKCVCGEFAVYSAICNAVYGIIILYELKKRCCAKTLLHAMLSDAIRITAFKKIISLCIISPREIENVADIDLIYLKQENNRNNLVSQRVELCVASDAFPTKGKQFIR